MNKLTNLLEVQDYKRATVINSIVSLGYYRVYVCIGMDGQRFSVDQR